MSNLNHCRGLSEFKIAELIELLEEWSPDRDDFSGSVCDQLTEDVQHVKKSDCQAIIDTRPTVFLTISDQYDHDVQKALLNLVNQLEKFASELFDGFGHPEAKFDAHETILIPHLLQSYLSPDLQGVEHYDGKAMYDRDLLLATNLDDEYLPRFQERFSYLSPYDSVW
ncbi:hypothetical protein KCU95_g77, partial [Aureobasidium melanogenum]